MIESKEDKEKRLAKMESYLERIVERFSGNDEQSVGNGGDIGKSANSADGD